MGRIKIGIDLDDVLNNLVDVWVKDYNELYDDNLKLEDIKDWEIAKYSKHGDKIFDVLKMDGFFDKLDVQQDAKDALDWLQKYADIYIVTATYPENLVAKVKWLNKYFPNIDTKNIIVCNNKALIDVDYLIDDSPKNMIGFKGQYILFDKCWNKYLENDGDFVRVYSWYDILKYFISKHELQ